jgi:hypothetical protein
MDPTPRFTRFWAAWFITVLLPVCGFAQAWDLRKFDDGSFFAGTLTNGQGMNLSCGERSPRGVDPMVTGNVEPLLTQPQSYVFDFDPKLIGDPPMTPGGRNDVMFVAGTKGYVLSQVYRDELFGTWRVHLTQDDRAFEGLRGQRVLDIRWNGGQAQLSAQGFDVGFAALEDYCSTMFAAIGKSWAIAPDLSAKGNPMRSAAEQAIRTGCNGPATFETDYLLLGDIDGDGAEDVVIDWDAVRCLGSNPRPFCGASMCSADVFLSSVFPAKRKSEGLLAFGVGLVDLSNGAKGVKVGGPLAACQSVDDCTFTYYWNGLELVELR